MKRAALIGACLMVIGAAVLMVLLQGDLFAQEGPWGGGRGQRPQFPRMGRGGGAAMTVVGSHLFVLSGDVLYKIDPQQMTTVKTLSLKPPEEEGEGK